MQEYDVALKLLLKESAKVAMRELAGCTVEKWLDVAMIRCSDRFQIFIACFAFFDEISRTPRKFRTAKLHCNYACDQPGMPAITVRKWVDEYKPMMKSNAYLIE